MGTHQFFGHVIALSFLPLCALSLPQTQRSAGRCCSNHARLPAAWGGARSWQNSILPGGGLSSSVTFRALS